MKTRRQAGSNNRRRRAQLRKLFLCFATFIMVAGLSISFGTRFVDAHDRTSNSMTNKYKYYKSIELSYGDTLWDIAEEYMTNDYDSIYEYIDELKNINGLESDDIHESRYLTVAYYDTEFK